MAQALAAGCPAPMLIVASDASRTRQTANAAAEAFGLGPAQLEPWLYRASAEEVMAWLWTLPDQLGAVMVVGHNPTMHVLVADLVNASAPDRFAPGTVAVVHFGIDRWAELAAGAGRLLYCATA